MKKLTCLFPALFIMACGATSDKEKAFNEIVKYAYADNDHSLLWEISGKGLKQPSFLYGTIHLQDKRIFNYDKTVMRIFDTCQAYAMEINMDEINPAKTAKALRMEKPLDEMISAAKYRTLDSLMTLRTGGGVGMYKNLKPFFMASELIKAYEHKDMPFPLDIDFFKKAKKAKMKTVGIEKFEEQLAAVDKMSVEEQTDMIIEGLKDWDKTKKLYDEMMQVYLKQDVLAMSQLMKDTTLPKSFEAALLTDRNKIMAQRMDKIMHDQPTFNAVGAGHLGGKAGVIELLRELGYTVKPVKFSFKK